MIAQCSHGWSESLRWGSGWQKEDTLGTTMPQGDKSKEECFRLWMQGKSIREIKRATTAKHESIKTWVREWERGVHETWHVNLKE